MELRSKTSCLFGNAVGERLEHGDACIVIPFFDRSFQFLGGVEDFIFLLSPPLFRKLAVCAGILLN